MRIDVSQSPALFRYASDKLGGHYSHDRGHKIITGFSSRRIEAQAIYTGISPGIKAELTLWVAPTDGLRAGRQFVRRLFNLPFVEWNCVRLHAVTRESNRAAVDALLNMGFLFESQLKCWFGDEEGWMFRMLRDECQWLKEKP